MDRRSKQKIINILVTVIGVLLIVYAAMTYYQRFGFRRYSDKPAGFSLRFPRGWPYSPNKDGANVIFYTPLESDYDTFAENLNVVVQDISKQPMKVQEYSEVAIKQMRIVFGDQLEIIDSSAYYLDHNLGYKFLFRMTGEPTLQIMMVWTVKGEYAYQITYTARPDTFDYYKSDIDKMIESFNITK